MVSHNQGITDPTIIALLMVTGPSWPSFHLCGSRFFGNAHENSDFDFFVEDKPGVTEWLNRNHFEQSERAYGDLNWVATYKQGIVHVIAVKSAEARLRVQRHIKLTDGYPPKGDVMYWDSLYRTLCPEILS